MSESDGLLSWPGWMPLPLQDDYAYEPLDRRSRTDMEVGSVLRVNFDTDETTAECTIICDRVQAMWFEIFERDSLNQGARWFEMPLQSGGVIEWHTVRFKTRPKASIKAPCWTQYRFTLELERRELFMCDEIMELLVCISPADFFAGAAAMRDFTAGLGALGAPDWTCMDDEYALATLCPEQFSCAGGTTEAFIHLLGKTAREAKI